ncbi:uncharacterized protein LOC123686184 [Harmonia axyridis]|uniref:uncharacterized protein LOC123686184 n=1 Tax=Harmonia axyridis TaxID=115357 RepID=UPI001E276755|nr:uncharacterized protein LOC123686184 [Harmonia axyridis]
MSLQSEGSGKLDVENVSEPIYTDSFEEDTSSTLLESVLELSKTQERKLFRKFGIFHSTSSSAFPSKEEEPKKIPSKTMKKRRICSSSSNKKAKRAKKIASIQKMKKTSNVKNLRRTRTFTVDESSSFEQEHEDSVETLARVPDNILDASFEDYDANIEHDSIATKYGLPYDIIQCACYLKDEIFGTEMIPNRTLKTVCVSQSCCDFEKLYGNTNQAAKYCEDAQKTEDFRAACEIYNGIIRKSRETIDEKEFSKAVSLLKVYYPHYWKYVSQKDVLYLYKFDICKEKFSKTQLTLSCMRLLKEQELLSKHYRIKMKGLDDNVKFNDRLNNNFTIACTFLKKEYPSLFVYLLKKYAFNEILANKLDIIKNRLKLMRRVQMSDKQLKKLNEKYKTIHMANKSG